MFFSDSASLFQTQLEKTPTEFEAPNNKEYDLCSTPTSESQEGSQDLDGLYSEDFDFDGFEIQIASH